MGYRSEVAICIKIEDYKELLKRVSENKVVKDLLDYAEIRDDVSTESIVIFFDFIKWYPDFIDVKFMMNYLNELEEKGKPYSFVRVGERWDDIEEIYRYGENEDDYDCDHIGTHQGISIY